MNSCKCSASKHCLPYAHCSVSHRLPVIASCDLVVNWRCISLRNTNQQPCSKSAVSPKYLQHNTLLACSVLLIMLNGGIMGSSTKAKRQLGNQNGWPPEVGHCRCPLLCDCTVFMACATQAETLCSTALVAQWDANNNGDDVQPRNWHFLKSARLVLISARGHPGQPLLCSCHPLPGIVMLSQATVDMRLSKGGMKQSSILRSFWATAAVCGECNAPTYLKHLRLSKGRWNKVQITQLLLLPSALGLVFRVSHSFILTFTAPELCICASLKGCVRTASLHFFISFSLCWKPHISCLFFLPQPLHFSLPSAFYSFPNSAFYFLGWQFVQEDAI